MPGQALPATGEVWDARLSPTIGAEQAGVRAVVVISNAWYNETENHLHLIVPMSGTDRGFIFHHRIRGREAGLSRNSVAMCDQVRAISPLRFLQKRGNVSTETLAEIRRLVEMFLEDQPPYTGTQ